MTIQFDIGAFVAFSRGGTYKFTLTPEVALVSDVTIRWAIVPKGAVAVVADFPSLTGTLIAFGSTALPITVTPTADALAVLSDEFEIRIYQVVADGDDILLASRDVAPTGVETGTGTGVGTGAGVATVETPPAPPAVAEPEPETAPAPPSVEEPEAEPEPEPEAEPTPQVVVAEPEAEPVIQAESVEQSFEVVEEQTTITHPEAEAEAAPQVVVAEPEIAFLINPASYTLLSGTKGSDTIAGTSATELIQGGHYGDTITTGGGDDVVIGGFGSDTIILSVDDDGNGAEHAETIVYRYMTPTFDELQSYPGWHYSPGSIMETDGGDVITGFSRGVDKLILADVGEAWYIESLDAVADKSDITEDVIAQEFVSHILGANDSYIRRYADIQIGITLNDWWGLDWDTDWGADGLSTDALDAGFRLGIELAFSGPGYVNGLTGTGADLTFGYTEIYFDRETTIWLGKHENWEKVTGGGTNHSRDMVESLEGLRYLFGDTDENDDLLQFALDDWLGVEVGTPDVVTTTEPTPQVVDDAPETAFLINPASYTLLSGTKGDDTIAGTSAAELIQGGNGHDTITTGGGDDVIIGGFGKDTITLSVDSDGNGATHAETIIYRYKSLTRDDIESDSKLYGDSAIQPADGADTITGFSRGVDKLILADMGGAYYIENNDAVADKSDITEDILAQKFTSKLWGVSDAKSSTDAGVNMSIILNDWDFFDSEANGLTEAGVDAGGRWGISFSFSAYGFVSGLTGSYADYAGSTVNIYFDKETTIWLEKQENWDKVTGGDDYSKSGVVSLDGLRYLFGDSDANDDLLQFTTADGLGVDIL
ncbi:MAG: hypothetical protein ACR2PV_08500 [Gammaproteobacteria bacterium]